MVSVDYQFDSIQNQLGDGFVGLWEYIILMDQQMWKGILMVSVAITWVESWVIYKEKEKAQTHFLIDSTT